MRAEWERSAARELASAFKVEKRAARLASILLPIPIIAGHAPRCVLRNKFAPSRRAPTTAPRHSRVAEEVAWTRIRAPSTAAIATRPATQITRAPTANVCVRAGSRSARGAASIPTKTRVTAVSAVTPAERARNAFRESANAPREACAVARPALPEILAGRAAAEWEACREQVEAVQGQEAALEPAVVVLVAALERAAAIRAALRSSRF